MYFRLPPQGRTPYDVWRWAEELFDRRDYTGAARELEALLEDPQADTAHHAQVRELLVRSYYHSARLGKAIDAGREALDLDPSNAYLVLLVGRALERAGRDDEAGAYLRRAAALGMDAL